MEKRRRQIGVAVAGRVRKRCVSILFVTVCFFVFPVQLRAETLDFNHPQNGFSFEFWGGEEGFSQARLRDIVQTRDGYLWFGTAGGLVRFDGVNFMTFSMHDGSLKDNEVIDLLEDDEGALWIATFGGGLTRLQYGCFTTFTTADGLLDNAILKLDKDPQGNLWMSTPSGVCRYSKGVFTSYTTRDGLSQSFINSICARSPLGIFAGADNQLHRLVDDRFEVVQQVCDDADARLDCLTCAADGSLWLTYEDSVIKHWTGDVLTIYGREDHHDDRIGVAFEHPPGTLWLGARDGLIRLANGTFDKIPLPEASPKCGKFLCMYVDREGNFWAGTETGGLLRIHPASVRKITAEDGLPDSSTRCVFQDSRGDIWGWNLRRICPDKPGEVHRIFGDGRTPHYCDDFH